MRCVINDSPDPELHHLNREPGDCSISNFVPISSIYNKLIGGHKSQFLRVKYAYGVRVLPPELDPANLLEKARSHHFREWRNTDAYGCAHLAYWIARWQTTGQGDWFLKFDALMEAIRFVRHAFHPTILTELLCRQLLPMVDTAELGTEEIARVLMELTSIYAWIGCARESNEVAIQLSHFIDYGGRKNRYDKRRRRVAQTIGVIEPNSRFASALLAEAAEAAVLVDEKADISATQSTIALVHIDPTGIKSTYERLRIRMKESDSFFHLNELKPMNMTLNNAIAEMWYLFLASLHMHERATAERAEARLRRLINSGGFAHRYLSPEPWPGSWKELCTVPDYAQWVRAWELDGSAAVRNFCLEAYQLCIIGGLLVWAFLMPGDHHGKRNSSSPAGARMARAQRSSTLHF
jgi:hypothetical protein